ncbi:MAG: cisplatin damage response ATP-dependent DNA ligase [Rhodospirillales bacterium]|nr:cisplatin damage response ATP-dependent DNA ligase [Rhodospirillales bacterium]
MRAFAELLEGLTFAPQRNAKLRLMDRYFRQRPDPDRGYGLAALTGDLAFTGAKPALIRELVATRVDPILFALSYDFVGDLAETAALIWPGGSPSASPPSLAAVVETLSGAGRKDVPAFVEGWLDGLDASARYALLKLITGGLRVGVSARLAKTAAAGFGGVPLAEVEELWHGLKPPYLDLFAWLEGRKPRPETRSAIGFRPLMLANPLDEDELDRLDPSAYACEWKWDGIRVQIAAGNGEARLFSRTGDDIGASFPDILADVDFAAVLDGELLVAREREIAPFNDLQQRLGRKAVTRAMMTRYPAHVRLYDILLDGDEDLRGLPLSERRRRLERWYDAHRPGRMDLSPLLEFADWARLAALRASSRAAGIEGLMLKQWRSPYLAGRPKGPWFKWKRAPLTADCVLMYAQRGHGKRSSFYSDYTFGCWRNGGDDATADELVPVGKAYSGFTDAELVELDRWVRRNTVDNFGPVRVVAPALVLEIAFDAVQVSTRHKSGVAMRFPRVHRIRWDKPAAEADRLEALRALIESAATGGEKLASGR